MKNFLQLHWLLFGVGNVILCVDNGRLTVTSIKSNTQHLACYLKMSVDQQGFHRTLNNEIEISSTSRLLKAIGQEDSLEIILLELFPPGLYIDTDQLASLMPFGGPGVLSRKPIDTEKPAFVSPSSSIYIFYTMSNKNGAFQGNISFPIHLRYHRACDQNDYSEVMLSSPQVLLKIPESALNAHEASEVHVALCDSKGQANCSWLPISCNNVPRSLSFSVPVGQSRDTLLVVVGTLVATLAATVFLGMSMARKHFHEDQDESRSR